MTGVTAMLAPTATDASRQDAVAVRSEVTRWDARWQLALWTVPEPLRFTGPVRLSVETLALHLGAVPERGRVAWLRSGLRTAMHDGVLHPGAVLPGSRPLADALGIARGTVVDAVQQLVDDGYLVARPRSGTVVVWRPGTTLPPTPPPRRHPSPGQPDLTLFPRGPWGRLVRQSLADLPDADLGYPAPAGHPELRAALAGHLHRTRGAEVTADDVVVVSGVAQAGVLLVQAGLTRWVVEHPGSPGQVGQLTDLGAQVRTAPVDADGLVPDGIDDVDVVVVTAAHQYPTGCVLAPHRRHALVDRARSRGFIVLEDDYDAELRYDREPVGVVQALAPDVVVLAGSVSKPLAPALRLGWMVPPRRVRDAVVAAKAAADLGNPIVDQVALARMITSGAYGRQVRRVRTVYRERRDALLSALAEHLPQVLVTGISAGLHVYLADLGVAAADRACAVLQDQGVAAQAVPVGPVHRPGPGLVVAFASIRPDDADRVVRSVAAAVRC